MLDNNTPCSPALDRNIPPSGGKCWRATAMTFDLAGCLEEWGGGGGEQGSHAGVVSSSSKQVLPSSSPPSVPLPPTRCWDLFFFFTSASSELSGVQSLVRLRRLKLDQRKLLGKEILQVTGSQAGHCVANGGRELASGWYFFETRWTTSTCPAVKDHQNFGFRRGPWGELQPWGRSIPFSSPGEWHNTGETCLLQIRHGTPDVTVPRLLWCLTFKCEPVSYIWLVDFKKMCG